MSDYESRREDYKREQWERDHEYGDESCPHCGGPLYVAERVLAVMYGNPEPGYTVRRCDNCGAES